MERIIKDLKYAWRRIRRSPGFTAVAVLSLGLGIGANTAIFTLIDAALLGDAPYGDPESLVSVYPSEDGRVGLASLSYPEVEDIREGTEEVFEGVAVTSLSVVQEGVEGGSQSLLAEVVTGNYFEVLGIGPILGRAFAEEEDKTLGSHPVVILGHAYWQRRFAADHNVIGQTLRLNGRAYTVIGVAPSDMPALIPGFDPDLWAPMMMINHLNNNSENQLERRGSHSFFAKARLKEGVTAGQAQVAVDGVVRATHEAHPDYPDRWGLTVVPSNEVAIHPLLDRVLYPAAAVLMAVVAMVLLIACVNLTSFLLARATDRRREIAIRLSLGAGRASLIRQLLTETVLLGLMGGAAGVAMAWGGLRVLSGLRPPAPVPMDLTMTPDAGVLLYSLLLSVTAGLFFGLVPAWRSTRPDVAPVLKDESVVGGAMGRFNLRNALVVAQVAVSFLLLIGSGLFLRSLQAAQTADPGFGHQPTSIVLLSLPADRYKGEEPLRFFDRLLGETAAMAGVQSAGLIDVIPLTGVSFNSMGLNVDGIAPPPGEEAHAIDKAVVDSGYFEAAGVEFTAGRNFGPQDRPDGPKVMVVSQAMARKFWHGQQAVGRIVHARDGTDYRVIGVARDTDVRALGEAPRPYVYTYLRQHMRHEMNLLAATRLNPRRLAQDIVRAARDLEPEVIIIQTKTMEEHLSFMLFPFRFAGGLLAAFGLLALFLGSIGLFGVLRFSVAGRMREMGIRKSLGAQARSVIRLVMGEGMRLVVLGMVIGAALALAAAPLTGSLLFGVEPLDWPTFALVALILCLAALAAIIGPALRAARVDPIEALRQN
ncbi:MAG TPA: ABC transporter permease [Acidobacteriota bacterium]|nr:ABC transporter permease [Acidobacteriota bacterium]